MPAVSYSEFVAEFPEFGKDQALLQGVIEAKLADAEALLSEDAYSDLWTLAIKYKAAALLALSPFGMQMRIETKDGESTYSLIFEKEIRPKMARRGAVL